MTERFALGAEGSRAPSRVAHLLGQPPRGPVFGGFRLVHKCIQLWETIMVRHGLMLVGQTMSGKTEVENVLSSARVLGRRVQTGGARKKGSRIISRIGAQMA